PASLSLAQRISRAEGGAEESLALTNFSQEIFPAPSVDGLLIVDFSVDNDFFSTFGVDTSTAHSTSSIALTTGVDAPTASEGGDRLNSSCPASPLTHTPQHAARRRVARHVGTDAVPAPPAV
ncbi:unnamed protein product, partial [Laminaria digitata]